MLLYMDFCIILILVIRLHSRKKTLLVPSIQNHMLSSPKKDGGAYCFFPGVYFRIVIQHIFNSHLELTYELKKKNQLYSANIQGWYNMKSINIHYDKYQAYDITVGISICCICIFRGATLCYKICFRHIPLVICFPLRCLRSCTSMRCHSNLIEYIIFDIHCNCVTCLN